MFMLPREFKLTVKGWVTTIGDVVSLISTVAIPVEGIELLSSTVNVTLLFPKLLQPKEFGKTLKVNGPHASLEPLLIWLAVIDAVPNVFKYNMVSWVITIGDIASITVTFEVSDEVFPFTSVTIKAIFLVPTSEQLKELSFKDKLAIEQSSKEPKSIFVGKILAFPEASRLILIEGLTKTVGFTVSFKTKFMFPV